MNAMLRIPQGEHNAWLFTLMYSPMGELNFPVPGVAFSWNPSPQFHANIGLPLMVMWRPTDDWQFQASYMLIRTIHLKAQYRFTRQAAGLRRLRLVERVVQSAGPPRTGRPLLHLRPAGEPGTPDTLWRSIGRRRSPAVSSSTATCSRARRPPPAVPDRVDLGNGPFAALNLGTRF